MLASLDNEVIFKKAFTNIFVFTHFVKDILGIDVVVDKIETEKRFDEKVGKIDFRLDIFAETVDKRIIIEIQRIEYDHNFNRFLHYFLATILGQQKSSKDYSIAQTVYVIVVLTEKYTISQKNGQPVRNEVLLLELNPRTLDDKKLNLYGHQLQFLNPNHPEPNTPKQVRDWLDLVYQSIHNPEKPIVNLKNKGIEKAVELINYDKLSSKEITAMKDAEMKRQALSKKEDKAREEGVKIGLKKGKQETKTAAIIKAINKNLPLDLIAELNDVTIKFVEEIQNELHKSK